MKLEELEIKLNHNFNNKQLLAKALTRKDYSVKREQAGEPAPEHQKEFATLGDAVFKLIVIEELMEEGVDTAENLTVGKSLIECRPMLAEFAEPFHLEEYMRTPEKDDIRTGVSAQGETLEAIIGAIHKDAGYNACKKVVLSWPEIDRVISKIANEIMQKNQRSE